LQAPQPRGGDAFNTRMANNGHSWLAGYSNSRPLLVPARGRAGNWEPGELSSGARSEANVNGWDPPFITGEFLFAWRISRPTGGKPGRNFNRTKGPETSFRGRRVDFLYSPIVGGQGFLGENEGKSKGQRGGGGGPTKRGNGASHAGRRNATANRRRDCPH